MIGNDSKRFSLGGYWFVLGVATLLIAAWLGAAGLAFAEPAEEDIGASPLNSSASLPREPGASEALRPRPAAEHQTLPESESSASRPATTTQPHATFPYSVRSGDTLGTIASLFGVSVDDLTRLNRISEDTELMVGQTLRVPNPFLARERELTGEIDQLTRDKQAADLRAEKSESALASAHARTQDLTATNAEYSHDLKTLPWWRAAAMTTSAAAVLMLGVMLMALVEWWILRNRFRAVAEMNEALRRLDFKYKTALAKAELRLQQLYGRRRRGYQDGQERGKLPEEVEIEDLAHQLKEVLEHHLERLGPPGEGARRARWRERVNAIGSPVEARTVRR